MSEIVLRIEGLVKRFGKVTAVDGLSFEVKDGEVFGLLGPNGAGKTTTIQLICGLLPSDGGRMLFRGKPLASGAGSARREIGLCPQRTELWERLTCTEQLVFLGGLYDMKRADARARSSDLLAAMDLSGKADVQARFLSGGMQRRLNLAMAFINDPKLVILDEPEAGLDPQSRILVRGFLRAQARRRTVILTTHNMDEADRIADRIAIMDHGKLLVADTAEALKKSVGEGDVIEIDVSGGSSGGSPVSESRVVSGILAVCGGARVEVRDSTLAVRTLDGVNRLPAVLKAIENSGFGVSDVRLRGNTLEDVFIRLTGRKLRE